MYVVSKKNLSLVLEELQTLQEERDNLAPRPAPVKSSDPNFHAIRELIRKHEESDKKIDRTEKKCENLEYLREQHRMAVTKLVNEQIDRLVAEVESSCPKNGRGSQTA